MTNAPRRRKGRPLGLAGISLAASTGAFFAVWGALAVQSGQDTQDAAAVELVPGIGTALGASDATSARAAPRIIVRPRPRTVTRSS